MTKNNTIERFLEFGDKKISILNANGTWYIAIKPICEALNVDYISQYKNIQEDEILSGVLSNQTTHDAINRLQQMACLPEKFVYGWLFSIRSNAKDLAKYKLECYNVLYNHFHGILNERFKNLQLIDEANEEIDRLEIELLQSEQFTQIQQLKKSKSIALKSLKTLDKDLKTGQINIFS